MPGDTTSGSHLRPFTNAQSMLGQGVALSEADLSTLRALSRKGEQGRQAFFAWWATVDIDAGGIGLIRLAPFLYSRARALSASGPLLDRLRGMSRHILLGNDMRMRALPEVLDALQPSGGALLLTGVATLARFESLGDVRPVGDVDLLIDRDKLHQAFDGMRQAGFHSPTVSPDRFTAADMESMHAVPFEREKFEIFDIHWRPVRDITDARLGREMRANGQAVNFLGRTVRVPALADHLFHLLTHGIGAVGDGRIDFILEAGLLVERCGSEIEWRRFRSLAARYMLAPAFEALLECMRDDLEIVLPLDAFPGRGRSWSGWLEARLRSRPAVSASRLSRAFLDFMTWRRITGNQSFREAFSEVRSNAELQSRFAVSRVAASSGQPAARAAALWAERMFATALHREPGEIAFLAGFAHPEATGRWTDSAIAALVVPAPANNEKVQIIIIRAAPFLENAQDKIEVTLATAIDLSRFAMTGSGEPRSLLVIGSARHGGIAVGLSMSGLRLPTLSASGRGDRRLLGLHVIEAGVADLATASLPATLAFDDRRVIYAQGWSAAEERGRWTNGPVARLLVRLDAAACDTLEVRLVIGQAYVPPLRSLKVSIGAIGERVSGTERLRSASPTTLSFQLRNRAMEGYLPLEISIAKAVSPIALGASSGSRRLGIFLEKIEIRSVISK
jgi:hypothetical protein